MSATFAQMTATPGTVLPNPAKHVNYTLGMLLGVDDFNQEFAYLSGRDQWMARDLIGYGTVCGLRVTLDSSVKGPRVSVTAGSAVSPRGKMICVKPAQCAYWNDWLTANPAAVQGSVTSPPGSLIRLYLVLCYRQCAVDAVPIAGEPCRSAADLMQPSRWVDDFQLDLRTTPPQQFEEDAIRDFVHWLDQIQITDSGGPFPNLQQFQDALRAALVPAGSPPDPASYFHFGSPLSALHVHPADACEYLRAAFRIWVTEIRPLFHSMCLSDAACACGGGDSGIAHPDECLLLTELDVPLVKTGGQNWQVDDKHAVISDESRRPILLHARMQQEWMQCGLKGGK